MSKKDKKKELLEDETPETVENIAKNDDWAKEFAMEELELAPVSSAEFLKKTDETFLTEEPETAQSVTETEEEIGDPRMKDPIFKELAEPKLPELAKENRARLQMQSPNRIQFYWSIKNNPFQTLSRVFGGNTGNYTLVAKLLNQTNNREEIFPVDAEGSWWFNVDADSSYQAEVGFYAPNRPYIRVMFSNVLETPRKSPSPRVATDADWAISAREFAGVLDYSGYKQDAFEVALAGDDYEVSNYATQNAFTQFIGEETTFAEFSAEEIRFALLAIASGYTLEDLRGQISATLFAMLEQNADKLTVENAIAALSEHFDISMEEIEEEEEFIGNAVYGSSLVNFPRSSRRKTPLPKTLLPKKGAPDLGRKISPVSSFNFGF
jgi:hypothetical protein